MTGKNGSIPAGFPQTEEGAQSAAANYAVALGSTGMFNSDNRHADLDAVYPHRGRGRAAGQLDEAYSVDFLERSGLDANGNAAQALRSSPHHPRGHQDNCILRHGQRDASRSGTPASSACRAWFHRPGTKDWTTFDLQWSDNDWKIADDARHDGPRRPRRIAASSADAISKAVGEYGGFTYAR